MEDLIYKLGNEDSPVDPKFYENGCIVLIKDGEIDEAYDADEFHNIVEMYEDDAESMGIDIYVNPVEYDMFYVPYSTEYEFVNGCVINVEELEEDDD